MFKRLLPTIFLLGCGLLLTACQTNPYNPREQCLSDLLKQCKQNGWHFMMTNPVCKQASYSGIYSLTDEQLEQCSGVDNHSAYQHRDFHQNQPVPQPRAPYPRCTMNKQSLYQHRNFHQTARPGQFQRRDYFQNCG